jgi:hypothetical protein
VSEQAREQQDAADEVRAFTMAALAADLGVLRTTGAVSRGRHTVTLFFEGRELKSYGEYVLAAELVVGRVYFSIGCVDADMVVPHLDPLVFLGRNLDPEQPGLYFQDASSYLAGERWNEADWEDSLPPDELPALWHGRTCEFHVLPEGDYSGVFEYEKALDQLLACSLRRNGWDGQVRPVKVPQDPSGD